MSKASEWAKRVAEAAPTDFTEGEALTCAVSLSTLDGVRMEIEIFDASDDVETRLCAYLKPDRALALAHWILDTFGEKTAEGGG